MKSLRRTLNRIGTFVAGRSGEQRLRDEMQEHVAMEG